MAERGADFRKAGEASGVGVGLVALLDATVRALSTLDAATAESMAALLSESRERVELPRSTSEWQRAASQRWVLGHLLGGTAQRLAMLRRIAEPAERFRAYGDVPGRAPSLAPGVEVKFQDCQ